MFLWTYATHTHTHIDVGEAFTNGDSLSVLGWGATNVYGNETATSLQMATVCYQSDSTCLQFEQTFDTAGVMCAIGTYDYQTNQKADTCQGIFYYL